MSKIIKNSLIITSIMAMLVLLPIRATALEVPDAPKVFAVDYSQTLSVQTLRQLNASLLAFERETSNQIIVAVFKSLEGDSLEDFSIRLVEKWQIGQKEKSNGAALLIFIKDKKIRIEVGYGLEGVLTDALSSQIIGNEIKPAFRAGNFDKGVSDAVSAMMLATKGEYKGTGRANGDQVLDDSWMKIMSFVFALIIIIYSYRSRYNAYRISSAADIGFLAWLLLHSNSGRDRDSGGSGGGFSGGGGGGFSGGGGGFGGGGASGGW